MTPTVDQLGARGRAVLRELVRQNPSPPRLSPALSGGLSMLLAVGLPTLAGRPDIGLLASAGALSALYLSARSRHERAARLPLVQLGLILAAIIGAAASWHPVLAAIALAVVAIAATLLVLGLRIGPPGALFAVLVAGVSERLTAPLELDGAGLSPVLVVGSVLLGAAIAYAVITSPLLLYSVRTRDRARTVESLHFALTRDDRVVLARVSIGVVLATAAGTTLGLHRTYWIVLAVVAVLQSTRGRRPSAVRVVHRLAGTLIGAGLFALLALLHPAGLLLAVTVAGLQFAVEMIIVRHYGLALVLITPLALTIAGGTTGDIGATLRDRIIDTGAGCLVAVVVLVADLGLEHVATRRHSNSSGPER